MHKTGTSITAEFVDQNKFKINFPTPNVSKLAAENFPVRGATGVGYSRRSAQWLGLKGSGGCKSPEVLVVMRKTVHS